MNMQPEGADDGVQVFQLESSSLRGRLVRLGPVLDLILRQHDYPEAIGKLLGEAMVIACALGTSLKYQGVFTLQAKTDGAARLLVADVTHDGGLRGYAQVNADKMPAGNGSQGALLGQGYLAFTVQQEVERDDRYQGIVELQGDSLGEAVQHYFRQSEQLPTGIVAAVQRDPHGHWRGGCLMLQRMPSEGGYKIERDTAVEDDWLRAMMLMGTCTPQELTDPDLSSETLLYRLFHEEGVRVHAPHAFRHQCRCSEQRVSGMLQSLPQAEIEDLAIDGVVSVTCEFCNRSYTFDQAKRAALYAGRE